MEIFNCDDRLASIILKQGFIERSTNEDQQKGKRLFKHRKNRKFYIEFDYLNFVPFEGHTALPGFFRHKLTDEELRGFLWYINLPSSEKKHLRNGGSFSLNSAKSYYNSLIEEFDFYDRTNFKIMSTQKVKRSIDLYNSINLN